MWSLHPQYLDAKGLVALWREGLLALKVLRGETRGYRNHPQLRRFRDTGDPVRFIGAYLRFVLDEAERRGYNFDGDKIPAWSPAGKIPVTSGQLEFEMEHLKRKLSMRSKDKLIEVLRIREFEPNPIFTLLPGPVEMWEKGNPADK